MNRQDNNPIGVRASATYRQKYRRGRCVQKHHPEEWLNNNNNFLTLPLHCVGRPLVTTNDPDTQAPDNFLFVGLYVVHNTSLRGWFNLLTHGNSLTTDL
jgi:hypothetical protein